MLAVIIGLLLIVAVAVGIVYLVAVPHLRSGAELLTPDGREAVGRAREKALNTGEVMKHLGGRAKETLTPETPKAKHQPKRQSAPSAVGRPRPAPAESGPIPVDGSREDQAPVPAGDVPDAQGQAPAVIDLREPAPVDESSPARHAR